jgi:hypothetical protein
MVLSLIGGVALFLISCSTLSPAVVAPLEIPGAHFVSNKACLDCHKEIVRKFPANPHARVHFENATMTGKTGRESCHGPAANTSNPAAAQNSSSIPDGTRHPVFNVISTFRPNSTCPSIT